MWLIACVPAPLRAPVAPPELAPSPPAPVDPGWVEDPELPPHRLYHSPAGALAAVLASDPQVLGVGELHPTTDGPTGRSAMAIFTEELLPVLAPHTTDLVLETWRLDGRCGPEEEAVASGVEAQTERPPETRSELVLLVEAALAAGVRPHDLALSCEEYAGLLEGEELVMGRLLRILTVKLQDFGEAALATPDATMVLYGGAVHNDRAPAPELAEYSYGPALAKGRYVELDLYPPELVTGIMREPAWEALLAATGPDRVVLHERAPGSFVMLLPTR